jgi:hypothetical protein
VSIEQAIQDIENLESITRQYLINNLDSIMVEFVVFETINSAKASNLPNEFVAGIGWKRTGELSGKIINTWGSSDKPLAKWFEDGTPDHWIEPLSPDGVLVWEASFGKNASAIFFMGDQEQGQLLYSKGHYVSGLDKTEAMARGIATGFKRAKTAILKNSKKHVKQELETIE